MKKSSIVFTALLALAMVATAACNTGGSKKKKSKGGGGGGEIADSIWEGGFSGAVTVGASTSVVEGREAQVMPSNANSSFATVANKRKFADPDTGDTYDFEFTFEYSASVKASKDAPKEDKPYSDYVESTAKDGDKTRISFKGWPGQGADKTCYPRFYVKAIGTCNGKTKEKSYTLVLNPLDKVYIKMSLAEVYTAATDGQKLKWMGPKKDTSGADIPDAYTGDLTQTEGQSFYWIETKGTITYCSNDANWGILENGEHAIQLYQLKEFPLWNRSTMMNVPVVIKGALSEGYGNVQMSYVQSITVIEGTDPEIIAPATPSPFTEAMIANKNWVQNPMFNKIVALTELKFVGNIKIANNGKAIQVVTDRSKINCTTSSSDRYEFEAKIGSETIVVAYDYHAVKDSTELIQAFNSILKSAAENSTFHAGGTLRWCNTARTNSKGEIDNDYSVRKAGAWVLVPFTTGQLSAS